MSSETSTISTTTVETPQYQLIAEQIAALMLAGKQAGMDQFVIRQAIQTFGQTAVSAVGSGEPVPEVPSLF